MLTRIITNIHNKAAKELPKTSKTVKKFVAKQQSVPVIPAFHPKHNKKLINININNRASDFQKRNKNMYSIFVLQNYSNSS